jgi:nudix motif 8
MKTGPLDARWIKSVKDKFSCFPDKRLIITNTVANNLHTKKGRKHAAVLVPLCNRDNIPSIVFTLRTQTVGTHKGQVSFPGGHLEPSESPVDAALREMHEELGLEPQHVTVLGECQTIPAITGTLVTPVVGYIDKDIENLSIFSHQKHEVDEVFTRTIEELLRPGMRSTEVLNRNGVVMEMPTYGPMGNPQRIWGLTAIILDAVLSQLLAPSLRELNN